MVTGIWLFNDAPYIIMCRIPKSKQAVRS